MECSIKGNATFNYSTANPTNERNIIERNTNTGKHAFVDSTDDHIALEHQPKKRRVEYQLITQFSPNNNATTDHQAQESSANSNNNAAITTTSNPAINNHATINLPTNEMAIGDDPATHAPKHPEFDNMIMNNEFGKALRKARWELYYPKVDAQMWQEDEVSQVDPIRSNL
ncbi:hypothetical protein BGZ47_007223 [Haplosporangium gracile]|nr:hypothetical protein BGZ47_007223 [Haplosporangium gracile]